MKIQRFFSIILFSMLILSALTPGGPVSAAPVDQESSQASSAQLKVAVVADSASVDAGERIGFTIVVTNTGKYPAYGVELRDQFSDLAPWTADRDECSISPAGLLTCKFGTLPAQASIMVHVSAISTPAMEGPVTNTAEAWGTNSTRVISNQASLMVLCDPDVVVKKTPAQAQVPWGQPIGFTLEVKNIGSLPAKNVTLTDLLPAITGLSWAIQSPVPAGCQIANGTLLCNFGTLNENDTRIVTIVSPTKQESCGIIKNKATVASSNEPAEFKGNNSANASTEVTCPPPALSITKTADAASVPAGSPIGFSITVSNNGSGPASEIIIEDQLPSNLTWQETTGADCSISGAQVLSCAFERLEVGASVSVHVTAQTSTDVCGEITNQASVVAGNSSQVYSNEEKVTVVCPQEEVNVSVIKTAAAPIVNQGEAVTFTMTVNNTSLVAAANVVLTDTLPVVAGLNWSIVEPVPAGCAISNGVLTCNFGELAGGLSRSVSITSPTTASSCAQVSNTATVTATGEPAESLADNSSTAAVDVVGCPAPGLIITKTADAISISALDPIGYTISVTNTGAAPATGVIVTDQLDNRLTWSEDSANCSIDLNQLLTCNYDTIAPGVSASVSVHVTAQTNADVCGSITNIASVEDAVSGQVQSDLVEVTVTCPTGINVRVTKTAEKPFLYQGEQPIRFFITVTNNGNATAEGVVLTDPLLNDNRLIWSLEAPVPAGCAINNQVLTCNYGDMPAGTTSIITLASPSATFSGHILNEATVSATNEPAENLADNTASATVDIPELACLNLNFFNGKYSNDFESPIPGQIGIQNYKNISAPKGQKFLGELGNETVTITIGCLPVDTSEIMVSFDLYIIRSWDGNATVSGPDHWKWEVDQGPVMLDTSFTNWPWLKQSYPNNFGQGDYEARYGSTAVNSLGFEYKQIPSDAIYHISAIVPYNGTDQTITLKFTASGLQMLSDESWGLDNFLVVPLPDMPNSYYLPLFTSDGSTTEPFFGNNLPVVNGNKPKRALYR